MKKNSRKLSINAAANNSNISSIYKFSDYKTFFQLFINQIATPTPVTLL